jgi:RNA polymerase sigma-54 factor
MSEFVFKQNLVQKMQMSAAMQQSLAILQMPICDLTLWLQEQAEQNPLVAEQREEPMYPQQSHFTKKGLSPDEFPYRPSLFSHLMDQARQICSDKNTLQIFEWIIGNLEPSGFFPLTKESIPPSFAEKEVQKCLLSIQQFDPPGVGAKDLQESLLLQLEAGQKKGSLAYQILSEDLDKILSKNFTFLQKKYQIEYKKLKHLIRTEIASLDPFPGGRFSHHVFHHHPADVLLFEEGGKWKIKIAQPTFALESKFAHEKGSSEEERRFFQVHRKKAHQIISSLEKRKETLYRITNYLIQKQQNYLLGKSATLVPLTRQEVASKLNLHESTIARALAEKTLFSPLGTIPLKDLLSTELSQNISSDQAKKLLCKLIAEENKKAPLSDRELLEKMQILGVHCSRRTIAKYRQALRILPTYQRKSF